MPAAGRGLCEICDNDDQCGGAGDRCLEFTDRNGQVIDHGCGRACGDNAPCPAGYQCVQDNAGGSQCRPYNAQPVTTCAAIRDMGKSCTPGIGDQCGIIGAQDAYCLYDTDINQSYCSVSCRTSSPSTQPMCIEGYACEGFGNFAACSKQ